MDPRDALPHAHRAVHGGGVDAGYDELHGPLYLRKRCKIDCIVSTKVE